MFKVCLNHKLVCLFAQCLKCFEVRVFNIEFHIVPIIDGYTSMGLCYMVEP